MGNNNNIIFEPELDVDVDTHASAFCPMKISASVPSNYNKFSSNAGDTCGRATVKNGQNSIILNYNSRNSVSKLKRKLRTKSIIRDKDSHLF